MNAHTFFFVGFLRFYKKLLILASELQFCCKVSIFLLIQVVICCCIVRNSRLDVYIHDYLVKRDLKATAQAFQAEGKVSSDPVGKIPQNCAFMEGKTGFKG